MTIVNFITIFALIAGPVSAVIITRYWDEKREAKRRRWEIFRTLMRTRRERLTPDFVGALNLIEVEFHREQEVIDAWKNLFNHLCQLSTGVEDSYEVTERLTATLLEKVAKSLGVKKDTLEIFKNGYSPQYWGSLENEQAQMRHLILEVLEGTRSFPVHISNIPHNQDDTNSENL